MFLPHLRLSCSRPVAKHHGVESRLITLIVLGQNLEIHLCRFIGCTTEHFEQAAHVIIHARWSLDMSREHQLF